MDPLFEAVSKITAKGQTTVPKAVRQALGVPYGGRIAFRIDRDGVTVRRADTEEDPVIDRFLTFLAHDLERRPEAVTALDPGLAARVAELTGQADVDPDAPIEGEVAL